MSGPYGPVVESASKADADAAWSSFEQCCAPGCICFPGSSVCKESACNAGDPGSIPWLGRSNGEGNRLSILVFLGFPSGSAGKECTCNAGDLGLIPGLGIYPGEGKGYPLQYSGLENSMDCTIHRVTKSQTRQSNFHFIIFT